MRIIRLVWILSVGIVIGSEETFTDVRLDVAFSLARHFRVSFCVFGKSDERKNFDFVSSSSFPSKKELLTNFLNFQEISALINENSNVRYGGKTMIILDMENSTLAHLSQVSPNGSLSTAIWVLFSKSDFRSDFFRDIYIPFDCEFIFVSESESIFSIQEIYRIGENTEIETYNFGHWTKDNGLALSGAHFYSRRNNLKGHSLKAIIKNNPPYVSIERDDNGTPHFKGYLYEIWSELEFRLNFRTEFPENYFNEDPEKVLKDGEVDVAVARISHVPSDFDKMDFGHPIHEAKSYMFGHRPGSELDWDSYLKPFSPNTWFVSVLWLISSSLALTILYKKAWDFETAEREANYFVFTFPECLLTVFRAICMQGSDITPRSNSCRLFFLSIYLTALVVTSAFSAALFSLLTIPKPRSPFNSLEEVLNNNKFKMDFPSDPDFRELVQFLSVRFMGLEARRALQLERSFGIDVKLPGNSTKAFVPLSHLSQWRDFSGTLTASNKQKLLKRLMESVSDAPTTPLQGLQKVCGDKSYIFVFDLPNVLYLMQDTTRHCQDKILPSGPPLFTEFIGFGFKKKNPYKGLINFHLIRMKNEGILKRLLLNYWPPKIPTVQASWVRVTLSDISPILYMFAFGAILGAVFLYMEKIGLHFVKRKKKKRDLNPPGLNNRSHLDQRLLLSGFHKTKSFAWDLRYPNH